MLGRGRRYTAGEFRLTVSMTYPNERSTIRIDREVTRSPIDLFEPKRRVFGNLAQLAQPSVHPYSTYPAVTAERARDQRRPAARGGRHAAARAAAFSGQRSARWRGGGYRARLRRAHGRDARSWKRSTFTKRGSQVEGFAAETASFTPYESTKSSTRSAAVSHARDPRFARWMRRDADHGQVTAASMLRTGSR